MSVSACDLLIIGAGPAGLQAAITATGQGITVIVADENPAVGGQIFRGIATRSAAMSTLLGADDADGATLAEAFIRSGARHLPSTTAFMIEPNGADGFHVGLANPSGTVMQGARKVLIATGALERPFPIPGWTLPGVMTAGAAQTLLKSSGLVPEGPAVLAGTGPLLYLLAAQYARAGVKLEAVLDTTPRGNWRQALRHLPGFLASGYARKGLALMRAARAAHPFVFNVSAIAADGETSLQHVTATASGRTLRYAARTLLLHQGVVPQVNLAMAAGAAHHWNETRDAFEPSLNAVGETTVPGLYVAGDSGGIGGAAVARHQGQLAAGAILSSLGMNPGKIARQAHADLSRSLRGRAFIDALYRPASSFRLPADKVIVCRCEGVTAGEIRKLARRGGLGPNQVKAFCRAGMGPCQGRGCALTVSGLIAEVRGVGLEAVGHMTVRNPVKPITVGQMAGLYSSP